MRTRGVDPDADVEGADNERLMRIILEMTKNGGYHEGHDAWSKWLLGICGTLAASGVVGLVLLYGTVTAFAAKMDAMQAQVTRIEKIVEPRYRGAESPP